MESRPGHRNQSALKSAVDAWFFEVSKARWRNMTGVKGLYATASVITGERIVFNIKGNEYRLVTAVDFEKSIVWIKMDRKSPRLRPDQRQRGKSS